MGQKPPFIPKGQKVIVTQRKDGSYEYKIRKDTGYGKKDEETSSASLIVYISIFLILLFLIMTG